MKTEDLERLKQICYKEGFKVESLNHADTYVIKPKIDEWEGVEFAECVKWLGEIFEKGRVYPIRKTEKLSKTHRNETFKPATEQAYKEQLIKEAEERYGEIREGDEFKRDWQNGSIGISDTQYGIFYDKKEDRLSYAGICIYEKGQWAKKIEKPTVNYLGWEFGVKKGYSFNFDFIIPSRDINHIGNHLAKCLKEYLTNKQNA